VRESIFLLRWVSPSLFFHHHLHFCFLVLPTTRAH
jgi:hypothetical protein